MTEKYSGAVMQIKQFIPECKLYIASIIEKRNIAIKGTVYLVIGENGNHIIHILCVKFKSFSLSCDSMEGDHQQLILYIQVKWLL